MTNNLAKYPKTPIPIETTSMYPDSAIHAYTVVSAVRLINNGGYGTLINHQGSSQTHRLLTRNLLQRLTDSGDLLTTSPMKTIKPRCRLARSHDGDVLVGPTRTPCHQHRLTIYILEC